MPNITDPPITTSILAYAPAFPNGIVNDVWAAWFQSVATMVDTGPVLSFNGRTGVVVPANGDYSASQITGLAAFIVANGVSSFNGRQGAVVPAANDYSFADLSGTATVGQIPNLPASQITSGQLALAQGGTGADLSATGGASQFVSQSTVGGALTVIQPAFTDLSGAATTAQIATALTAPGPIGGTTPSTIQGTTITASTQFSGPGTGLTGTASSLTAGTATAANGLNSATTTVSVSGATAPTSGQVLTATSSTTAVWQTPSGGGAGAFNRIVNGSFYQGLAGWGTSGTTAPIWNSNSASANSGSASVVANVAAATSLTTTGSIYQGFSVSTPSGALTLNFKTSIYYTALPGTASTGYVKVYLYDLTAATETLIGTYNLTGTGTSVSFTSRSITVTSNITAAGDYGLRFEIQAVMNNTDGVASSRSTIVLVDEVNLVI